MPWPNKASTFLTERLFLSPSRDDERSVMSESNEGKVTMLHRDGKPPLRFTALAQWEGSDRIRHGTQATRWTDVVVYRTKGGKIVVRHSSLTCWQGESDVHRAESFNTAQEAIAWLARDGELGEAAQECLRRAAEDDAEFAASYVEDIA